MNQENNFLTIRNLVVANFSENEFKDPLLNFSNLAIKKGETVAFLSYNETAKSVFFDLMLGKISDGEKYVVIDDYSFPIEDPVIKMLSGSYQTEFRNAEPGENENTDLLLFDKSALSPKFTKIYNEMLSKQTSIIWTNHYTKAILLSDKVYFIDHEGKLVKNTNGENLLFEFKESKINRIDNPGFFKRKILEDLLKIDYILERLKEEKKINNLDDLTTSPHSDSYLLTILREESQKNAIRAAISQVMARNMSHNIGSHVLNHLINDKSFKPSELKEIISKIQGYKGIKVDEKSLTGEFQLANLINYIKSRMDYLSEVTFGKPTMQSSRRLFSEVFKEFDRVRILLNHISGISKFPFSICLANLEKPLSEENDIKMAWPSDLMAWQAFYNIIENIIRNSAKYNQQKTGEVTFTVDIKDIQPDGSELEEMELLYQIEISDGISIEGNIDPGEITEKDKIEYKDFIDNPKFDNWDSINYIDWLVARQNIRLNQPVLNNSNSA